MKRTVSVNDPMPRETFIDRLFSAFLGDPKARVRSYGVCGPRCVWPKPYSEYFSVPINDPHGDCE